MKNGNYYFRNYYLLEWKMEKYPVDRVRYIYTQKSIYIYIRIELKGRKGRRGTSKDERECTSVSCLVIVRAPRGMNPLVGPRRQLASTLRYPDTGSNKPRGTKISHGDPWTPLLPPPQPFTNRYFRMYPPGIFNESNSSVLLPIFATAEK